MTVLRDLAFADLDHELANTRRTIERIPDAHLGYRPHEKSWTIGNLGLHLGRLPFWGTTTLVDDDFDLAALPPSGNSAIASVAEVLALFDEHVARLRVAMAATTDDRLQQPWTLRHGTHVIVTMPRAAALRTNCISHMVHHRGQLALYLRLLDVPVPGLYGPSADER